MCHGPIIDKDAVAMLIFVTDAKPLVQASIHEIVVIVKELFHFRLVQEPKAFFVLELLNHCAAHAQVQVHALEFGNGVFVDHGMQDARIGIDRHEARPTFLLLGWQHVKCRSLVSKVSAATLFGHVNNVIARMREDVIVEAAVVVPLWSNAQNAVTRIIGETKDIAISTWRGWMLLLLLLFFTIDSSMNDENSLNSANAKAKTNASTLAFASPKTETNSILRKAGTYHTMCAMNRTTAPPSTGRHKFLGGHFLLIAKDQKATMSHFFFESLTDRFGRRFAAQVDAFDGRANGIERLDLGSKFLNEGDARWIKRGNHGTRA